MILDGETFYNISPSMIVAAIAKIHSIIDYKKCPLFQIS